MEKRKPFSKILRSVLTRKIKKKARKQKVELVNNGVGAQVKRVNKKEMDLQKVKGEKKIGEG
jgi:hypothetical protein